MQHRPSAQTCDPCAPCSHSAQANPHTIAYAACLQDAGKLLEDVGPGTSVLGELTPEAVAAVSERVFKQLRAKDDPLLAAAQMQVR